MHDITITIVIQIQLEPFILCWYENDNINFCSILKSLLQNKYSNNNIWYHLYVSILSFTTRLCLCSVTTQFWNNYSTNNIPYESTEVLFYTKQKQLVFPPRWFACCYYWTYFNTILSFSYLKTKLIYTDLKGKCLFFWISIW